MWVNPFFLKQILNTFLRINCIPNFTNKRKIRYNVIINRKGGERMEELNNLELIQRNVEDFSRLQSYMRLVDRESEAYKAMKIRYIELKVALTASGVNLTELDIIKE